MSQDDRDLLDVILFTIVWALVLLAISLAPARGGEPLLREPVSIQLHRHGWAQIEKWQNDSPQYGIHKGDVKVIVAFDFPRRVRGMEFLEHLSLEVRLYDVPGWELGPDLSGWDDETYAAKHPIVYKRAPTFLKAQWLDVGNGYRHVVCVPLRQTDNRTSPEKLKDMLDTEAEWFVEVRTWGVKK